VAQARDITELSREELAEVERLESELDVFIEKRAQKAKDVGEQDELWAKKVRREKEKRRQQNGWGWIRHFEGLARAHRALAQEHDVKADHVRGLLGLEGLSTPSLNGHNQEKEK
jgi:hypothetical protein